MCVVKGLCCSVIGREVLVLCLSMYLDICVIIHFLFVFFFFFFFFFSSRRRHTRWTGDWSSDVCSSDLIALVFTLLLFLYESFRIAVSVMLMPLLAICAVFIGLWITGIELNISAMMGMTMIVGIVTEIAIFYFSEFAELRAREEVGAQTAREDGRSAPRNERDSLRSALVQAGRNRMRPILMSTIAAILTLTPLALAIGQRSEEHTSELQSPV